MWDTRRDLLTSARVHKNSLTAVKTQDGSHRRVTSTLCGRKKTMYKQNKEKNKTKLGKLCTLKKKTYTIFTFCQRLAGLGKPFLRTVTNALSSYCLHYVEGEKRMFTGSTRHKYFPCLHHQGMECTRKGTIEKWQDQALACQIIHSFWYVDPP